MMSVAPPARPAPPAEVRELGAAGRAVARRHEARAKGDGRGRRLEGVSARAPLHWRRPRSGRNSAVRTQSPGAVWRQLPRPRVYLAPVGRRTLRRVARPAQHRGVVDVEGRTASGERHDVIDGQVTRRVGGATVAGAPVAVLTAPGTQHAGAQAPPGPGAVQGVVSATVGLPGVLGPATARATGDDTRDRARLHARIVDGVAGAVYSLRVLGPRHVDGHRGAR